jgi:hypothetical protein
MRISSQPIITARSKCSGIGRIAESGVSDRQRSKRFSQGSYGGLPKARAVSTNRLASPPGENGNGVVEKKATLSLESSRKQLTGKGRQVCGDQTTANKLLKISMGMVQPSRKDLISLGARINENGTVTYPNPIRPSLTILENWTES